MIIKYFLISILILFSLSVIAQDQTSIKTSKWELNFDIQWNKSKIEYEHEYGKLSGSEINYIFNYYPHLALGFHRNFKLNDKFSISTGVFSRAMFFSINITFSYPEYPNWLETKDHTPLSNFSTSLDFPILFKYNTKLCNNNISYYIGFRFSYTAFFRKDSKNIIAVYDPKEKRDVVLNSFIESYPHIWYKDQYIGKLKTSSVPDYSFIIGTDYYISNKTKISFKLSYYPKDVILAEYSVWIDNSIQYEQASLFRPKIYFGIGTAYLF